jgi:hypothetical protein
MSKIPIDEAVVKQALGALEEGLDAVRECLDSLIPYAGLERYDRRIVYYEHQVDRHEAAIQSMSQSLMKPAQRKWVGLTEDEAEVIAVDLMTMGGEIDNWIGYWRAIEAKLKEKNCARPD